MLVKNVCWRKTCMLVKTKFFLRSYFSPTYFTNIHLNFCSNFSPTYRKIFTNILHQQTFKFLFKFFTNIQYFSPTSKSLFPKSLFYPIDQFEPVGCGTTSYQTGPKFFPQTDGKVNFYLQQKF